MDTRSGTSSPTIPHAYIIPMPGSEPNMNQNVTSTGSESSSLSTQNGNQNDMSVGSAESSSISVNNPNQSGTSTGSTQSSTTSVQRTTQSDTSSRSQSSSPSTQIDALAQIEWPPSLYLLSEKNRNHKLCLDLHKTALEGNVDEGKRLLRENSGSKVLRAAITEGLETVLHVAAGAKQTRFVEEMMKYLVEQEDMSTLLSILKLQNHKRNTAFCFAVMVGSMEIVQTMLDKDLSLLTIRGGQNMTPLYLASVFGQREIASFLYNKIRDKGANALEEILTAEDKRAIFFVSIKTTLYDLAYKLLDDQKELALAYNSDATPLHLLARTPLHLLAQTPSALTNESDKRDLSTQALELVELLWEKLLDQTDVQVKEYFHEHSDLLFDAAHLGNFEFLARLIHLYPDLVHKLDEHDRSIFHIAIMHRHTKVFNLIYEIGFDKELIATYVDKYGNSLLHLAAKYPDPRPISMVPGAALEMQEELITFKEVELLVKPIYSEIKNSEGKTPRQLFTIEHANLLKQGEEWMRNTANSCMVVATLIATIVFAATFQLPGGNNQGGIPIHLRNIVFHIFAMAESIALSSSSISILMFLSILTSRYTENDFLISLPRKLVVGVSTLFISIATMMLAFISSIFLAYDKHRSDTIPLLCTIFVFVPVFIFVFVQYELFKDISYSSFRLRLSTKPRK